MKRLFAIAIVLISAGLLSANPQQRYQQQPYYVVPSYGAGQGQQQIAGIAELIDAINALTKRIQVLEGRLAQAGMAIEDLPSHVPVFKVRCASCHDKGVADKKGGSFALLDGGREMQLTADQRLEVISRVHGRGDPTYDMPRGGQPLSKEEYTDVVSGMSGKVRPPKVILPKPK